MINTEMTVQPSRTGTDAKAIEATEKPFLMRSPTRSLQGSGVSRYLPAGTSATLGARVHQFFDSVQDGPRLLVGALPFDREHADFLLQPRQLIENPPASPARRLSPGGNKQGRQWQVIAEPTAAQYSAMVTRALKHMQSPEGLASGLDKVVLARRLRVATDVAVDPALLAARLAADPAVTAFVVPLPVAASASLVTSGASRVLVGGTPELLVAKRGLDVRSNPLAGSARRQADPVLDRKGAAALKHSEKDRREHLMVVEAILDNLTPYCVQLKTPRLAELQSTASMWHLGSVVEGRLRDREVSSAELAACLHPTPAVAGSPRLAAQDLIRQLEPFDRGFYAGAVGWTDGDGDGEWYVSLRCGELSDNQILLYAGAGIVAGSDPVAEAEETSGKFMALLSALGIDEHGRQLPGDW